MMIKEKIKKLLLVTMLIFLRPCISQAQEEKSADELEKEVCTLEESVQKTKEFLEGISDKLDEQSRRLNDLQKKLDRIKDTETKNSGKDNNPPEIKKKKGEKDE